MSVTPIPNGDNAQAPFAQSDTYIPDQLIAGNLKLVTDTVNIGGGLVLKRGTVMGRVAFGTINESAGTAFASGTVAVAGIPNSGDTLTIQGTAITFLTQPASYYNEPPPPNTVYIQATTAAQAQALLAFLENSTDSNLSLMSYSLSGSTITAVANIAGTGGNAYTLATSNSGAFTLSGATLAGGTNNTGNPTFSAMSLGQAAKPGNYKVVCLTATTANVFDPNGALIGPLTFGTAFKNAQINFTITAGGTPCVAGDTFILNANTTELWKQCVGTATDGSEVAAAILADWVDATGGTVRGGIYQMGEFNGNAIILDPSLNANAVKNQLRSLSIFIKQGVVTANDPN